MTDQTQHESSLWATCGQGRNPVWLMTFALVFLVLATFVSVLNCDFVDLDTPVQLLNNPTVHGLTWNNVLNILSGNSPTTSYYPVRSLSYALDYEIWGLRAHGFKLTNVVIHLSSVLLLFWLILRLSEPGAGQVDPAANPTENSEDSARPTEPIPKTFWNVLVAGFAAGLFAIHPVVVEPVAWVPGREELLMTLWALVCFHCYMTARKRLSAGSVGPRTWAWYAASALSCLLACLSNAVAVVIPLLLTAWDALAYRTPTDSTLTNSTLTGQRETHHWRRILYGTAVLWVIAVAAIVAKRSGVQTDQLLREMDGQKAQRIAEVARELGYGDDFTVGEVPGFSTGRLALMLNVFQLNVRSLAWPDQLAAAYSTLPSRGLTSHHVIPGLIAACLLLAVLWLVRRRRLVLFGLCWFLIALAPSSQIIHHHIHRADRFLYLPLVGLVLAIGFAVQPLRVRSKNATLVLVATGMALLLVLNLASRQQIKTWENAITLWQNCLRVDPDNFLAHHTLATLFLDAGEPELAKQHFEATLRQNMYNVQALDSLATYLAGCGDTSQRDYELAIQLATWAGKLTKWNSPKIKHTLAMAHNNYAVELGQRGEFSGAIGQYMQAIAADAQYAAPLLNLALLRTACEEPAHRDAGEAVMLARRGLELVPNPSANELMILAVASAEIGLTAEAVATTERAIAAADAAGNGELAATLRQRLEMFRAENAPSKE